MTTQLDDSCGYALTVSSRARRGNRPLHCPAALRRDRPASNLPALHLPPSYTSAPSNTSPTQSKRSSSPSTSTHAGPPTIPIARRYSPSGTPSSELRGNPFDAQGASMPGEQRRGAMTPTGTASMSGSIASLRSPLSPSSSIATSSITSPAGPSQSAAPQGKMLPRAEWHPDASTSRCSYRDCTAVFPPVRASPPSASASAEEAAPTGQKGLRALSASLAHLAHNPLRYHRRHHCRACGRIYCAAHSSSTLPLEVAPEDRDCPGAPGLPYAAAAASADTEQQGSPFIARITGRKGSWTPGAPARGAGAGTMLTPPLSTDGSPSEHYFAGAGTSAGMPAPAPIPTPAPVVNARVCDDCHVSLLVAASLASINQAAVAQLQSGKASPPLARRLAAGQRSSSTARDAPSQVRTSAPASARHSPAASTSTSPSATTVVDQRARQESGDSLASATSSACASTSASASSSAVSLDTAGTTPPSAPSGKTSPCSPADDSRLLVAAAVDGQHAAASTTLIAGDDAASPSMAEQYGVPQRLAADVQVEDQAQVKQQAQAQAHCTHARVAQLASNQMHVYGEGNPGTSGPPDSLESSIGSTPGAGWTWSTF